MKKQLIFSAVVLLSTTINAQGVALNCQQNNLLFTQQTLSSDIENLDAVADKSEINSKNSYSLSGNVVLNSSKYYLAADKVNVNKSNKILNASGNVEFQNNELMLTADKVVIQQKNSITQTLAEQVHFHYPNTKIKGQARKASNDGNQQTYEYATYSTCPLGNNNWQIKADNINLNTGTNRGVAKNVVLEVLGVPVFYLSHYQWVLEGRESGFLSPSFSSYNESDNSEGGSYRVRIPYYFNIAPDRDLLLTLNHLSSRGNVIEGIYRQLIAQSDYWQGGRFEIEGQYLAKDDISNDKRWLINSKLDLSINDRINLAAKVNRVSDVDYFKDIALGNTAESSLRSEINATYKDNERDLALSLFAESEQLVNNGTVTYTRAPELSISKGIQGLNGRYTKLLLVGSDFTHNDNAQITGLRTHAQANFKRLISTDAYSITPSLDISNTNYDLDNAPNQNRAIATFNIDSQLFLERQTSLFNTNLVQTLTPRLAYRYTPKRNQSELPNFDSVQKNNTYEGLFSGQEFTGFDRINNANNFTVGLESEFINQDTGDTYLSLKTAQSFYLDSQSLNLDGVLVDRRKYSDIAAAIGLKLGNFTFNSDLQLDPETGELNEQDNTISYHLNARKFLTLAYHDDNNIESIEAFGAYPINQNIHIFGGVNRSLTDSITNRETTGIAYESCCWALRLAHFKEHTGGTDFERTTSIEFVLKGLASSSPSLAKRLEKNIPNYLANLNN